MKKQLQNLFEAMAWVLLASVAALIVLGLASCTPTKVLTESDTQVSTVVSADVSTQLATREWVDKYLSERVLELSFRDVLFERVEYDTSLPVSSETGKPPVKSETKITDKSVKESAAVTESAENRVLAVDSSVVDKSVATTDVQESVSVVEKKGVAGLWKWLIAIGVVAVVGAVVWLVKKVNF